MLRCFAAKQKHMRQKKTHDLLTTTAACCLRPWWFFAGEGSIPGVKERIKSMKKNFAKHVVQGYLEAESLTKLLGSLCRSIEECPEQEKESTRNMASQCGSTEWNGGECAGGGQKVEGGLRDRDGERVHRHAQGSHPVANMLPVIPVLIGEQCGKIWYVEKGNSNKNNKLHRCHHTSEGKELCGAWHFKFWESELKEWDKGVFEPGNCLCGVMLQHEDKKSMYHTVRTDWKELLFDHTTGKALFDLPRCRKAIYERGSDHDARDGNTADSVGG